MRGSTYIRYSDLFNEKPSLATLKKELRKFDPANVLFHLTRMNVLLGRQRMLREGREAMQKLQGQLIANYIDDEILEGKLKPKYGSTKTDECSVFTRQQSLGLLRLIATEWKDTGAITAEGKTCGGYALGRCCLIMNDHLLSKKEEGITGEGSSLKRRKHLSIQLAPLFELYNPPRLDRSVVRAEILFKDLLESEEMQAITRRELRGFDLARAFVEATGLKIETYRELILAVVSWICGYDAEQLIADASLFTFQRDEFIKESQINPSDFDHYLALDSISVSKLRSRFKAKRAKLLPHFDYVLFRSRPLLELDNGTFICADACFAVEKLSSGIYWTIIDSLQAADRQRAFDAFGYLFELYVNRILATAASADAVFVPSPKYTNGEGAFDALIYHREERHLIVFEHKASFLRIDAKYGGRIRAFEQELSKKFGVGKTAGTEKGIAQLAKHIERLFHRDVSMRHHIGDLDELLESSHSRVEKISPVLIGQEPFLRLQIIEGLLNEQFRRLLKRKKISAAVEVRPLAVIDIDTIEDLKPNLMAGDFSLMQCLNARAHRDPDYKQFWPELISEYFPHFGNREDTALNVKFAEITDRVKRNLFGG